VEVLLLSADEVASLLEPDALLEALRAAFIALSTGQAAVPPRTAATAPAGLLAAMPGWLAGAGLGIKAVSVFAGNHELGLPSHQAVIVLVDDGTGAPLALLDGTHITAARTASAAALSADTLARPDARVLAVLGAGVQGAAHLEHVRRVRSFTEVRLASRTAEHAQALAAAHPGVAVAESFEAAVRGADVVCCCTHSAQPVLRREWLAAGAHLTSVGASPDGPELDVATVAASRLFVESRVAFRPFPAGAHELQGFDPDSAAELGEVLAGIRTGRGDDGELTLYKSMGHAVEDLAAARLVYDAALAEGRGRRVTL